MRLELELLKTELALEDANINSTVVVFGSARIPDPAKEPSERGHYYETARAFARKAADRLCKGHPGEFVIMTGGGPGIMEAANRGARDAGHHTIGLNISLPHEQTSNSFVTPDLDFKFHYFALRKLHFLLRARALIFFPGGFGTLDELFEVLTLKQTGKIKPIPILLFGKEYWDQVMNFDVMVSAGTISADELKLFEFVENVDDAVTKISDFYDLES